MCSGTGPTYSTSEPDAEIVLYEGQLRFSNGTNELVGPGTVRFVWGPSSRAVFNIGPVSSPPMMKAGDGHLELLDDGASFAVKTEGSSFLLSGASSTASLRGFVTDEYLVASELLDRVTFHVPNLVHSRFTERLTFEADGWRLRLELVDDAAELYKLLSSRGGNGFTHYGCLERIGSTTFSPDDAFKVLKNLAWFLSFATGRSTAPILVTGFRDDVVYWRNWTPMRFDPYRFVRSWWRSNDAPTSLEPLFPEFVRLLDDPIWETGLVGAVHWYVESNPAIVENGIVLSQVGLELLAWLLLVEDGGMSRRAFRALPSAAERVRRALAVAGISPAIPPELRDLAQNAAVQGWTDGPEALTWFRNSIAHGTRLDRVLQQSTRARDGAKQLALWYLEMLLLHRLGYACGYSFRLDPGGGETREPPWVATGAH